VYSELVSCCYPLLDGALFDTTLTVGKENPSFPSYPKTCHSSWLVYEYGGGHPVGLPCPKLLRTAKHANMCRPRPHEHLMIVYYDILLLDGRSLLDVRHSERFKLLEQLIHCDGGQAELIQRQKSTPSTQWQLRRCEMRLRKSSQTEAKV
jgi:hypothetical protein